MATTNNLTRQNGKNKTGKQNRKSIKNLSNDKLVWNLIVYHVFQI